MRTSENLTKLCGLLSRYTPDFNRIVERIQKDRSMYKEIMSPEQFAKIFSELSLDVRLKEIAEGGLVPDFVLHPELPKKDTGFRYFYQKPCGALKIEEKSKGDGKNPFRIEYDNFGTVDGFPVRFEITMMNQWKCRGRGSLHRKFIPENYGKRLEPIERLFDSEAGLVVVIPLDIYGKKFDCDVLRAFRDSGGQVVPFYASSRAFKERVDEEIYRHRLF